MLNIQNRHFGLVAGSTFAALLISCASDGSNDNAGQQSSAQPTGTVANGELANKEAQLRAARDSVGAAKTGAKSCFDGFGACVADSGVIDQACLDQLTGCLPVAPPAPTGCPKLPEPTPEQVTAVDDAVGQADDLVGEVIDFAGEVEDAIGPAIEDLAGQVDEVVGAILDGGIPLPPSGGAPRGPGGAGHNKGRGDAGAALPPIAPDLTIGGGELCGVPLPQVPVGALKACADQAAEGLKAGTDLIAVATSALSCIEAPFQDDIAQLCGEASSMCGQPGAPANICAHVIEVCAELTAP
jgi:hypothetical protein